MYLFRWYNYHFVCAVEILICLLSCFQWLSSFTLLCLDFWQLYHPHGIAPLFVSVFKVSAPDGGWRLHQTERDVKGRWCHRRNRSLTPGVRHLLIVWHLGPGCSFISVVVECSPVMRSNYEHTLLLLQTADFSFDARLLDMGHILHEKLRTSLLGHYFWCSNSKMNFYNVSHYPHFKQYLIWRGGGACAYGHACLWVLWIAAWESWQMGLFMKISKACTHTYTHLMYTHIHI